ncbi:hypothetical protein [uncultured Cellulomonas sp.]|uniref:hypothetical protein n=1 Tax=uncultured Cellulomonas sp. TaxID=189682 RepID=UPI0028E8AF7A|nr:hypothetical protein [uncultured Cellulomonas sp.]
MRFTRITDRLPEPQSYLLAGLPRPDDPVHGHLQGDPTANTVGRKVPAITPGGRAPTSTTVVDAESTPVGILWSPSGQYLTRPVHRSVTDKDVLDVERGRLGLTELEVDPRSRRARSWEPPADPVDLATARLVTIDFSVILAGLEPRHFAPDDALFVSTAIAIEKAVVAERWRDSDGQWSHAIGFRPWDLTVPVAVDNAVLRIYAQLVSAAWHLPDLDRTDLLCAATAIAYQAPMYTTKPDAYRPLRNGLRVLAYGKVRDQSAGLPPAGDAGGLTAVHAVARAHRAGEAFGMSTTMALVSAMSAPEELARLVVDILETSDADRSWHVGVLECAQALAPALAEVHDLHDDLMTAVAVLSSPLDAPESPAALAALGHWGTWPRDADDEILGDIEDDPTGPASLAWYEVFLRMARVPPDVVDAEVAAVRAGTAHPSRERINQLSVG